MREALREPLVKSTTRQINKTAHGFSLLAPVYFNGTTWVLAYADNVSQSNVTGIVTRIIDDHRFEITTEGYFKLTTTSGSLVANTVLYLTAAGTAGAVPTTTGHVKKALVIGESSSSGFVNIGEGEIIGIHDVDTIDENTPKAGVAVTSTTDISTLGPGGDIWTAKESTRAWYGVAMSADGTIQTAVVYGGQIYVSTDSGNTWTTKDSSRYWIDVAVSADGTKQTAVVYGGQIYVSTDSSNTWTAKDSSRNWNRVAMSADGTKQTAVVYSGQIYVSTDSGNTWTAKDSNRNWSGVAMSADGTKQTATVDNGQIYVSTDSGNTWTAKESNRFWSSVAMSADGTKQTAIAYIGQIYVSTDSGNTWTAKESTRYWKRVAISADGTKQTAVAQSGQIYVSTDSGNTWTAKDSSRYWRNVAMSANGAKQTAIVDGGQIYVSTGATVITTVSGEVSFISGMKCRKVTTTHAFAVGNWIYRKSDGTFALAKSDAENTAEVIGVVVKINGTTDFWYVTEGYVTGLGVPGMTTGAVQWLSSTTAGAQTETKPSTLGQIKSSLGVAISASEMSVNITHGTKIGQIDVDTIDENTPKAGVAVTSTTDISTLGPIGDTWTAKDSIRAWYGVAISADGTKQTAVDTMGQIYVSTDSGNTWTAKDSSRYWRNVAMSADGTKQTAIVQNGQIYVSTDSGNTWTAKDSSRNWNRVAMSADGTKQTAVVQNGQIYVSTDSGNTWTAKDSSRNWSSVAMSADGTKQTATVQYGQIYVSTDSGNTWTAKDSSRNWSSVAMSADGTKQTAVVNSGQIYVSTDSGNTWTAKDSIRAWYGVAMSADGTKQTAVVYGGQIYVSTDSGNTWTAKDSSRWWTGVAMSANGAKQTAIVDGGQIYVSTGATVITTVSGEVSFISGMKCRKVTTTHAFAVGNWIYRKSDGTFALAKSDAENTAEVIGVVVKINGTTDFWYVTEGYVTGLGVPGMTTGAVQWLSAIPGAQTETKPSTLGQIKSSLGVAISASEMSVNITRGATVERINGSGMADTAISTTSYADTSGTLVLTAGTWNVYLSITTELALSSLSGGTRLWHSVAITKADNTIIGEAQGACIETGQSPLRNMGTVTINRTVELSGSDTLKIRGKIALWAAETYATTTSRQYTGGGALVAFYAIRIA